MNPTQTGVELSSEIDRDRIIHCLIAKLIHNSLDCPARRAMQFFCISTIIHSFDNNPKPCFTIKPGWVCEPARTAGRCIVRARFLQRRTGFGTFDQAKVQEEK
jgi:hypothetical protein